LQSYFDDYVIGLASYYAHRSVAFDNFITQFLDLFSVKTLPLITVLWLLWFSKLIKRRQAVVEAFLGMFTAIAVSRLIQDFSPERLRPLLSGNPKFVLPFGVDPSGLEGWSSFPSDHTALVFALSTAVWRVSRPLGAVCYSWSVFVVCLPRIYAGYHYASDILGGVAVGLLATMAVALFVPVGSRVMPRIRALEERYTALFYASAFVGSYQFVTLFDDVRDTARGLAKLFF
jgi:membrane-associated phospholipid phosphatase